MSAREQEKSSSKDIESAFTTMVQRWLVKGTNGKWQLPVAAEKKEVDSRKLVEQGSESRKRRLHQPRQPGKKAKVDCAREKHVDCSRSEPKNTKAIVETTGCNPGVSRLNYRARCSSPSDATRKDEHPLLRSKKGPEHKIKGKLVGAEWTSSTTMSERFLILNSATTARRGNRAKPLSTAQYETGIKMARVEGDVTGFRREKDLSDVVKQEVQTMSPGNCSTCTNTTEDTIVTDRKVSFDGIPVLCNGQRKCRTEGCFKAALQRYLCPEHGGRDNHRPGGCKSYTCSQDLRQAHLKGEKMRGDAKRGSSKAGGAGQPAKLLTVVSLVKSSGCHTTKSNLQNTGDPVSISTTRKRPNLQTKRPSKSLAPDAWQASDLPSLFRNAGKCTGKVAKSLKTETVEYGSSAAPPAASKRKPLSSKDDGICKVRCCKQAVVSEGFCKTHVKWKRCRKEGCNNIAAVRTRDFCWYHAPVKECGADGCTTKARKKGRCAKHGGKHFCRGEGCVKVEYKRGLCNTHWRQQDPDARIQTRTRKRG